MRGSGHSRKRSQSCVPNLSHAHSLEILESDHIRIVVTHLRNSEGEDSMKDRKKYRKSILVNIIGGSERSQGPNYIGH